MLPKYTMKRTKSKATSKTPQKPQVRIKVSDEQLETLRAAANKKGLGVGPWMRTVCLDLANSLLRAA